MRNPKSLEAIYAWKQRREQPESALYLHSEIERLASYWQRDKEKLTHVADFFPIRLVALLEVFFRITVKEIIDSDRSFLDRAIPLTNKLKFDILFAADVYGHKLSLGDIISHSLPMNEIEHIIYVFEILVPGYRAELANVVDRWAVEISDQPNCSIIDDIDETISRLVRLFAVRHILVHERPTKSCYEVEEIEGFLEAAEQFTNATDWFVMSQLHGRVPLTQRDMTMAAGDSLERAKQEMMELFRKISDSNFFPDAMLLEKNQRLWSKVAKNTADLESLRYKGGSIQPMVWASAMEEVVKVRTEMLRSWLEASMNDEEL